MATTFYDLGYIPKAIVASEHTLNDSKNMTQDVDSMVVLVNVSNDAVSANVANINDVAKASNEMGIVSSQLNEKLSAFKTA